MKKELIKLKIKDIKEYENNARKNDQAVDAVSQSIKECGYIAPICVDENNVILCGHTRVKSLRKLRYEECDVIRITGLTEEQKKKYRLLDNKTNELAEWDFDMLEQELEGLNFETEWDWGIDTEEEKEVVEDNFEPELPEEPKTKLGDIYQLGNHRLMCGDSTNREDVEKLANGELMDLFFSDPPYNVDIENSDGMKIMNDNMGESEFKQFLLDAFGNASEVMKSGGAFYIWHGDSETVNFRTALEENNLRVKQCLIWVKNGFNFGRQDYKWQHEPCLYGWKDGAGHYFVEEYNHPTVIEDKLDLEKMKKEDMKKLLEQMLQEKVPTTVVHENRPLKNDLHPTMKPIVMCADMIKHSSRPQEKVLDLFGGSGSTLMACEQLNRTCYMMEYDPQYVDVIINRWETFTGKKAIKL